MKGLTDIPGIRVGHVSDFEAVTGCTAILCEQGAVGGRTGATAGKLFGRAGAMKGGVGSYTVTLPGGVLVSALCAVNAVGDVRDPATGKIVAGARVSADSREFIDAERAMLTGV